MSGSIALDLVDGGPPANMVRTTQFSTDGIVGGGHLTGGASGQLASLGMLTDSTFFSELLQDFVFGDFFSFIYTSSDQPPPLGMTPDGLSLFLLDSFGLPLVSTTDPTGANALFLYELGSGASPQLFSSNQITITAQTVTPNVIPEPSTLLLLLGVFALCLLTGRFVRLQRPLRTFASVLLGLCIIGSAYAEDLTSVIGISKSAFVLNRTSNTFDTLITLRNNGSDPVTGPLRLIVSGVNPADVALYNSYGRNANDQDYLLVPLSNGVLPVGATVTVPAKFINRGRAVNNAELSVDGIRLSATNSRQLNVKAYFADGLDGTTQGVSVGAGYVVKVDGYLRGLTDSLGQLTIQVPLAASDLSVTQSPNAAGTATVPPPIGLNPTSIAVLVGDGGEIYDDSILRFDQVQQYLLPRSSQRISLRFLKDERAVQLSQISYVQIENVVGQLINVTNLFSLQSDGSISAPSNTFYQALQNFSGKAVIRVDGTSNNGQPVNGTAAFYLADSKIQVQLAAPPSNPNLPLAGIVITATILNTDVLVRAQSDATGRVVLPDLPFGNMSFDAKVSSGSTIYSGTGTAVNTQNSLVTLTMRGPIDVLNGVPPLRISVLSGSTTTALNSISDNAAAKSQVNVRQALNERYQALGATQTLEPTISANATTMVAVSVASSAQNVQIQQSAQLVVPQGTDKVSLKYNVASAEYPTYVTQQSIYNDVWGLSVIDSNGNILFDITRQVNSQLTQPPVWLSNGTTGFINLQLDVSSLTQNGTATLILHAFSVNIGDSILPTSVSANLDAAPRLKIGVITPDSINAHNNGNYYSVPRPGATNLNQRTFTVNVSIPTGSTITSANVKLRNSSGGDLMEVLPDTAPGQSGVQIVSQTTTSAVLKVRTTVQSPASTVVGTPPPTRDLTYHFTVKGTDSSGNALSDEKDETGKRSLWKMPDQIARYGSRDAGGDDWAARGTYSWLITNSTLLPQVNDVSGEHGRDLGHITHAKGTDIDIYHFYLFPGVTTAPGQGDVNHQRLLADVVTAFGTVGVQVPPAAAVAARDRVIAWTSATRTGLTSLAASTSVSQVIHCQGLASQGLPAGWCKQLLTTGSVTRTIPAVPPAAPTIQTLTISGAYTNSKLSNNDVHNNHIHVTLLPSAIGE